MKKVILIISAIMLVFAAGIFADDITPTVKPDETYLITDWWKGGPARIIALGGIESALPDSSNIFDLYTYGFVSAILDRKNKNMIFVSPKGIMNNLQENQYSYNYWIDSNVIYWISDEDVILFTSDYNRSHYNNSFDLGKYYSSDYTYETKIQYSHEIDKYFSFGAEVGFSKGEFLTDFVYDSFDLTRDFSTRSKDILTNFSLDTHNNMGLVFDHNLNLALKIGFNWKNRMFDSESLIDYKIGETYFDRDKGMEIESDLYTSFGVGIIPKRKNYELVIMMIKYWNLLYEYYDEYHDVYYLEGNKLTNNQLQLHAKFRSQVLDFLLVSLQMHWVLAEEINANIAIAYYSDKLKIPLQINIGYDSVFRGGIEYYILDNLIVRGGFAWYGYEEGKEFCDIGYTSGIGLEFENVLIDIGMKYDTYEYIWKDTEILIDMKILI